MNLFDAFGPFTNIMAVLGPPSMRTTHWLSFKEVKHTLSALMHESALKS